MNKQKTEIVKLLQNKQETCARLLQKTEEQVESVGNQDSFRLAAIIEVKERLIAGLVETDQTIAELVSGLDEAARESLVRENQELGRCIESDLKKIIEQENICQEKLGLVKNEVVEKILSLKKGQTILKGYGALPRIKPKISKNI